MATPPSETFDKVALAFSGGKDSLACVRLLQKTTPASLRPPYRATHVVAVTFDVGIEDEDRRRCEELTSALGLEWHCIDLRRELTEGSIPIAIQANADYHGYPLGAALCRALMADRLADFAFRSLSPRRRDRRRRLVF
jgi:argininosuccinate synthase